MQSCPSAVIRQSASGLACSRSSWPVRGLGRRRKTPRRGSRCAAVEGEGEMMETGRCACLRPNATNRAPAPIRTMRLELGYALPNLLALGVHPLHGRYRVRFNARMRHKRFDTKALRKRRRFFDECSKVSFQLAMVIPLSAHSIGPRPALPCCCGVGAYGYCG